jgi:hypothetical protein
MKRFCTPRNGLEPEKHAEQIVGQILIEVSVIRFSPVRVASWRRIRQELVRFKSIGTEFHPLEVLMLTDYDYCGLRLSLGGHLRQAFPCRYLPTTPASPLRRLVGKFTVSRLFRSMATASCICRAFQSSVARPRTVGAG